MLHILYEHNAIMLSSAQSGDEHVEHTTTLEKIMINFYFCVEGRAVFSFGSRYSRTIEGSRNYVLYNPEQNIYTSINLSPHTKIIFLAISLEHMHTLFLGDTPHFLKSENTGKKFYDEQETPASLRVVLHQLFSASLSSSVKPLYYQGKVLEILSLLFSQKKTSAENCPFLNDQEVVRKIKHAKEYLLKNYKKPPQLKALAKEAGLNDYQLKVGFKHIYGNTVFGFLLDRKLSHAQYLLDSKKYRVNDVAYLIGYANPSHFIAAFKKRFGITPKKYLMSH